MLSEKGYKKTVRINPNREPHKELAEVLFDRDFVAEKLKRIVSQCLDVTNEDIAQNFWSLVTAVAERMDIPRATISSDEVIDLLDAIEGCSSDIEDYLEDELTAEQFVDQLEDEPEPYDPFEGDI